MQAIAPNHYQNTRIGTRTATVSNSILSQRSHISHTNKNRLYSSLNCNRIALHCLKVKGNHLSESMMMRVAEIILVWLDRHLNRLYRGEKKGNSRYERSTRILKQLALSPCSEHHQKAIDNLFASALPAEYLAQLDQEPGVLESLTQVTLKLTQQDLRYQQLRQNWLIVAAHLAEVRTTVNG